MRENHPAPRLAQSLHRFVVATARGPLRRLWMLAYAVAGCAGVACYIRGARQATIYLRNGATRREFHPGLSDLDFVIVAAAPPAAGRIRANRDGFAKRLPWIRPILDQPLVLSVDELRALAGVSAFTYGLDPAGSSRDAGVYFGAHASQDATRVTLLPGLDPESNGWKRIVGHERRQPQPPRDAQDERVAAWLELSNWWRIAAQICLAPDAPNAAAKCVKLVADTAASWLWLEHREPVAGRVDALRRALAQAPEEAAGLRGALQLHTDMTRRPTASLADLLPTVARFSVRIVELIESAAARASSTQVRLLGEPDPVGDGSRLPLCDWVGLAWSLRSEEDFTVTTGDVGDPGVIATAARAWRPGSYTGVRHGPLLVMPAPGMQPTRLRAIKCRAADPVVFAVADGRRVASFAELAGWSAVDTARRAVAEHRSWLRSGFGPVAAAEARGLPGYEFELLLAAARAALFLESINRGDPSLTLTTRATVTQLSARAPSPRLDPDQLRAAHAQLRQHARRPPSDLTSELRAVIGGLPAYSAVCSQ